MMPQCCNTNRKWPNKKGIIERQHQELMEGWLQVTSSMFEVYVCTMDKNGADSSIFTAPTYPHTAEDSILND